MTATIKTFGGIAVANCWKIMGIETGFGTPPFTSDRGVIGGGDWNAGSDNQLNYITISTTGNAIDFGDLTALVTYAAACSNGNNERGLFGGGNRSGVTNVIDYITISSVGNAVDFGDLTVARNYLAYI